MKKKIWAAALALTLVAGIAVGGTVAWLTDTTQEVTNTFSPSNIDITLTETWNADSDGDGKNDSWNAQMIPGITLEKDPKVTVTSDIDCYVFVKVTASNTGITVEGENVDLLSYTVAEGWIALDGVTGVYYREVAASSDNKEFDVLTDNQVAVPITITKAVMDELYNEDGTVKIKPTLTFTAYAVQKLGFETAAEAWDEAESLDTTVADPTT